MGVDSLVNLSIVFQSRLLPIVFCFSVGVNYPAAYSTPHAIHFSTSQLTPSIKPVNAVGMPLFL